jgi:predicted GNAT family N-acyltransferase
MSLTRSEFVDCIHPVYNKIKLYDRTRLPTDQPQNDATDPAKALPQGFIDAMVVREEVYVKGQNVPLENELDDDDARSFHWVVYASIPVKQASPEAQQSNGRVEAARRTSNSTKIPIGTIRLVPPPHARHPTPDPTSTADGADETARKDSSVAHDKREAYIKLGRLAVIPEFRKAGISKLLIETALSFARANPYEIIPPLDPARLESLRQESDRGIGTDWKGLAMVHSQDHPGVRKVWQKYGFEVDNSLGRWDEEGIPHVAMFKRLDIDSGRRKSRPWGLTSPLASP